MAGFIPHDYTRLLNLRESACANQALTRNPQMTPFRTALLVAVVALGCSNSRQESLHEVRGSDAPSFSHEMPADSSYYMPESTGSGIAFLDFDGDGDLDIYAINGASPLEARTGRTAVNQLFRQDDQGYVDVTEESGLGDGGFGMGVAVSDIDNDGWVDVFVTNVGPRRSFPAQEYACSYEQEVERIGCDQCGQYAHTEP